MTNRLQLILGPLSEIRADDVIDILFVSIVVYAGIIWLRRTGAALVAGGILLLALLYGAASALGLQLTAWILQGFFAVFLIVVVIMFQEELRQLFERLALWSLRRRPQTVLPAQVSDVLVECLTELARERRGALIVLPGEQPIARHIRGGIELGAVPSVPLLESIFDPHSPGHDGAVVIDKGRVERFAVHLPLSSDFVQLAGLGTRHGAALGLVERTDALCLVVSEERGRISVAKDGGIRLVGDGAELRAILNETRTEAPAPNRWHSVGRALRENWLERFASVSVVLTLWLLFVPGARIVQRRVEVTVSVVGLPEDTVIEKLQPPRVAVTFGGPARAFYLLQGLPLEATIDASRARMGRSRLRIRPENVQHPPDLELRSLQPQEVTVVLARAKPEEPGKPTGG